MAAIILMSFKCSVYLKGLAASFMSFPTYYHCSNYWYHWVLVYTCRPQLMIKIWNRNYSDWYFTKGWSAESVQFWLIFVHTFILCGCEFCCWVRKPACVFAILVYGENSNWLGRYLAVSLIFPLFGTNRYFQKPIRILGEWSRNFPDLLWSLFTWKCQRYVISTYQFRVFTILRNDVYVLSGLFLHF